MTFGVLRVAAVGVIVSMAGGCIVENNNGGSQGQQTQGGTPFGGGGGGGRTGNPSSMPMLVDVDPNVTMTANPGDGVGVFTEYATGGHWHVWWTCDTNKTGQSCSFDVKISVPDNSIANVKGSGLQTGDTLSTSTAPLEAVTTTSTGTAGVNFDTTPGATVTLDAAIGGIHDGSFLFFVQKGQINGGFTGTLTDPLMLEGASP